MKLSIFILLLLPFGLLAQEKQVQIGCIGFYNFENYFDTINQPEVNDEDFTPTGANRYTAAVYMDKMNRLAEVISQVCTDETSDGLSLFGVAEVENRKVLEDFAQHPKVKDRNYKVVHFDSKDARGVDVGLFYNPKYFKPIESTPLFVELAGDEGKGYYTRDILWVKGQYLGEELHVFVNHWPSRRGGEERSAPGRKKAASVCRHVIDSLQAINPKVQIIVMGDLNDDPTNESVTEVLRGKGNRKKLQPGDLFNPMHKFYVKGYGTLAHNDAWSLFDQLIISQGLLEKEGWYFKEAKVFRRSFLLNQNGRFKGYPKRSYLGTEYNYGYSDHLPVYLILMREKQTAGGAQ
jgi:hypothetical protein